MAFRQTEHCSHCGQLKTFTTDGRKPRRWFGLCDECTTARENEEKNARRAKFIQEVMTQPSPEQRLEALANELFELKEALAQKANMQVLF